MERVIYLSLIKFMKKPLITKSIKKNSIVLAIVLFIGYLIFNFFTVLEINYYFIDNIDVRLKHEIEHLHTHIAIDNDSNIVIDEEGFKEYDMLHVSDNSYYLQIYDTNGNVTFKSENLIKFNGTPSVILEFDDEYFLKDEIVNYQGLRVCYTKIIEDGKLYGYLQLATPQTTENKTIENIISFNLLTLPLAFLLFVIVSIIFAKRTLNPINKIIEISDEITATNLKKRIEYEADSTDEFGRLKATLNNLFDRLEFQINQISQFSDNASHQLMTPLTAINSELEYILKREHSLDEYKETLETIDEQTSKMIKIVKTLLILAKDCEVCVDSKMVFNLTKLLNNEIKEEFKSNNVTINISKEIYLKGNKDYFKMVLENLIGNSIKYSSENDEVTVKVDENNTITTISIYDLGIGISDVEKTKVFQRFYRSESDEVQKVSGYGLGLSLVRSITESMGGSVRILNNNPKGSIFEITLPILKLS